MPGELEGLRGTWHAIAEQKGHEPVGGSQLGFDWDALADIPDLMHHGGDKCSAAAHARVDKARMQRLVYDALAAAGEATADELAEKLDLPHNSVAPRLTEMRARELVIRTGKRRETRAGSMANVLAPARGKEEVKT